MREHPLWRRLLFGCTLIFGFAGSGTHAADAPASQPKPPNILFCIADDWSWPHAGAYADPVVKTPAFDRVAREGMLFTRAFCATPSCSPSRAAILTGQMPHRLKAGANLWGYLPKEYPVFTELLEQAGYVTGLRGKGWGPGNFKTGGYDRNPAGPGYKTFEAFLKTVPQGKPFCFWFGSSDPHRPYASGSGGQAGLKAADVVVPPYFPDTPAVRNDILDYYFEVQRFDSEVDEMLKLLEVAGLLKDTLVIITSDNGLPFPRCKTNLHDSGSRMPLAMRWPGRIKPGSTSDALVSLTDIAPTLLSAAGLKPEPAMTGKSLLPLFAAPATDFRPAVFLERERHANVRQGDLSYPVRAIRTADFLFIRNLKPDRWPAGDPQMWKAVGAFGDCDNGPTKELILKDQDKFARQFQLGFAKRPAEELYDLAKDPHQVNNVAGNPDYAEAQAKLRQQLNDWMRTTQDPRAGGGGDEFERYPYYGK